MAKISDTQLALLRPDFTGSNALMNNSIKSIFDTLTGVKTQVDEDFAERKANATGSLLQQISQSMPTDYNNNPEARALFDNQISQFASNNNLGKEGVNQQDIFSTLNTLSTERDTNRGAVLGNQAKELANKGLDAEQKYKIAFNKYSAGGTKEDFLRETNDLATNRQDNQNKTSLDNLAISLGIFNPQLQMSQEFREGRVSPTIDKITGGIADTIRNNEARTTGKSQASAYQRQNSYSGNDGAVDTGSASRNIQQSLIGTESSGNPTAIFTSGKSGNSYGGLMQFGDARLKDYANSTSTKPISAKQFRNLSAAEQQKVNDWHTEDLIKKAQATGAIGKTINGVPVTLGGLVAVAHIGGYGGMQKFVKTNGKYNPQDDLGTSLTDYLGKHAGAESGGGNSEYEQLFQQATQSSMRPEDLDELRELGQQVGAREDSTFDKLYTNMQNAAPDPINPALFSEYQSPEMLSQKNQGLMDTLTDMQDSNIEAVNQLSQFAADFDTTVSDRNQQSKDALTRLQEDMANTGSGAIGVDNYVKKQDMFKKWLFESAITPEMFNNYPTDLQGALIEQQVKREQNFGKADRKANSYINKAESKLLGTDSSYASTAKEELAKRAEKRRMKQVDNVGSQFFSFGKNDVSEYLDKRANFESSITIHVDNELKKNAKNYFRDKAEKLYAIGTDAPNVNKLVDIIIEEYDKIVAKAKDPKTEYLSKNLTGKGMFLSAAAISEATTNGLLRHAKAMQAGIKKNTPVESTDQDFAASDILTNYALKESSKKEKTK